MHRRRWFGAWLLAAGVIAGPPAPAGPAPTPIVLRGAVEAKGTMGPLRYKVEGTGPLLPDAPKFHLTTTVPITQVASAKPLLELESPRGRISVQVTHEVSIKDKVIVPFRIVGGTGAYARAAGSGRIKIELLERSGLNGTVRLTFLLPEPPRPPAPPAPR